MGLELRPRWGQAVGMGKRGAAYRLSAAYLQSDGHSVLGKPKGAYAHGHGFCLSTKLPGSKQQIWLFPLRTKVGA